MGAKLNTYQTSQFAVLSISFEKADAVTRGRFAFFDDHIKSFVNQIHDRDMGDAFVVSTCNRTEIYTTTHNYMFVAQLFCDTVGVQLMDFMQFVTVKKGTDALDHLFRVAAGLESQILGDFEIISQIKNAYKRFKEYKQHSNAYLERAINSSIQVSKRIKNETGISNGAASVSYAAVHYILKTQKQLGEKNILLLGVGEIGQNTIENLVKHVYKPKVKIANRTSEKAEKIAQKYQIPHINFENFSLELKQTDILIVATGAAKPILFAENIPPKDLLVIDLSIPKNVDKNIAQLKGIELIDVDTLSAQIQETLEQRKKEIPKAEIIIKEMSKDFIEWEKKRKMAPHIHFFKNNLKRIEQNEIQKAIKKNGGLDESDLLLTHKMIQKITNRFAKYIIENPHRSDEVSKLLDDILNLQPKADSYEEH
ncbi:glutamyl-tRNA reductase [Elizabethkingia argentiflava]|uniref:Glutamyl-tRNA reductase n=1 Tax=Elizabethkingia argenteiflava TaxID=2681556 RepID=A0A845PU94_9FLAO|nr:glutamyl-tRNA reductase [Elizabethkingia argenteiflava]NAW50653.1 glutamyl-tRNA reductase [Elizabethkingia argenteiflava]